jgi:predicted Zn finger-like uncharacterized protein
MSLATRCSACSTVFRVQQDQLKASEGWVRCGRCGTVFSALEGLFDLEREGSSGPVPLQHEPVSAPPKGLRGSAPTPVPAPVPTPQPTPAPPPRPVPMPVPAMPLKSQHAPPPLPVPPPPPPASPPPPAAALTAVPVPVTPAFDESIARADALHDDDDDRYDSATHALIVEDSRLEQQERAQEDGTASVATDAAQNEVPSAQSEASGQAQSAPQSEGAADGAADGAATADATADEGGDEDADVAAADRAASSASFSASQDELAEDDADLLTEHSGSHTIAGETWPPNTGPAPLLPSFVRESERAPRWQRPVERRLTIAAAVALPLALLAQVALHHRDTLAARSPASAAVLRALCAPLNCSVQAPRALDAVAVESSGLTRVEGAALYKLQVSLRNQAAWAVAMPALDLTLTDSRGDIVTRRVLRATELAAGAPEAIDAGAEWAALATLDVGDRRVTGYTIELFYP